MPPGEPGSGNAEGYRGVKANLASDTFAAKVYYRGEQLTCGTHEHAECAALVYDRFRKERIRGKAGREMLNFPRGEWPHAAASFLATTLSGHRGVSTQFGKGKGVVCGYNAWLLDDSSIIHDCGFHEEAEDAAHAYDEKARELGLPEELMNFPRGKAGRAAAGGGVRRSAGGAAGADKLALALLPKKRGAEAEAAGPAAPPKQPRLSGWSWKEPASAATVRLPGGAAFLEEMESAAAQPPSIERMRSILVALQRAKQQSEARLAVEAAAAGRLRERLYEAEREERLRERERLEEIRLRKSQELREKAAQLLADAEALMVPLPDSDDEEMEVGAGRGSGGGEAGTPEEAPLSRPYMEEAEEEEGEPSPQADGEEE
jgi:hypothetical protein